MNKAPEPGGSFSMSELLEQLLDLPAAERIAALRRRAANDPALCTELEAILAEMDQAPGFLDNPLVPHIDEEMAAQYDGTRIGPYRIIRELPGGGMGVVYEARRDDGEFDMRVAIKVIRRELTNRRTTALFRNERQILARLAHPNVARILDGGALPDGRPYFVLEFIDGLPVHAYCREAGLSFEQRVKLMSTVLRAIAYLHESGVVHGDLKPGNLLVDRTGAPKLLDFGIARALDLHTGSAGGADWSHGITRSFASPEQLEGAAPSVESDIYSAGVILHLLLTGTLPQYDGTPPSRAGWIASDTAALPASEGVVRRKLRREIDGVLQKALAPLPGSRYAQASQMAEDLERFLDGRPVAAVNGGPAYRAAREITRRRWLAFTVPALGVTAGAALMQYAARMEAERRLREVDRQLQELIQSKEQAVSGDAANRGLQSGDVREVGERVKEAAEQNPPRSAESARRRAGVLGDAQRYLRRVSMLAKGDAGLSYELAKSYAAIGDLWQAPEQKINNTKSAVDCWREAEALAKPWESAPGFPADLRERLDALRARRLKLEAR